MLGVLIRGLGVDQRRVVGSNMRLAEATDGQRTSPRIHRLAGAVASTVDRVACGLWWWVYPVSPCDVTMWSVSLDQRDGRHRTPGPEVVSHRGRPRIRTV